MKTMSCAASVLSVLVPLLMVSACAERKPVSHFVVVPPADQAGVSDADVEQLRAVLDAFAAKYKMPKVKPGQAGIIRYYQATPDYSIGFFAKREPGRLTVFALPMIPAVASMQYFAEFRQDLANTLSREFPGRVSLEK